MNLTLYAIGHPNGDWYHLGQGDCGWDERCTAYDADEWPHDPYAMAKELGGTVVAFTPTRTPALEAENERLRRYLKVISGCRRSADYECGECIGCIATEALRNDN